MKIKPQLSVIVLVEVVPRPAPLRSVRHYLNRMVWPRWKGLSGSLPGGSVWKISPTEPHNGPHRAGKGLATLRELKRAEDSGTGYSVPGTCPGTKMVTGLGPGGQNKGRASAYLL